MRDPSKTPGEPAYWKDFSFRWPGEARKVRELVVKARQTKKDVYWAPAVFSKPKRDKRYALPTNLLWADLDATDPRHLDKGLDPFAWWETSPGRFQAIWRCDRDLQPNQQSLINRKLTYKIGADKGGWDLTQVLRLPGTPNHKYDDVLVSKPHINGTKPIVVSKLTKFEAGGEDLDEAPIPEGDLLSPDLILKKYRIPIRAKQLLKARPKNVVEGQRSDRLWELECLLAEKGLDAIEIVSLTRPSVWNKFRGRRDELVRLTLEAKKAITHTRGDTAGQVIQDDDDVGAVVEEESTGPLTWREFDRDHQPIRWLVADVWGESEVGFISGTPKSYKSWLSLDLAVSVATGTPFLDAFKTERKRVLLIQEEDPKVVTQDRLVKIAAAKGLVYAEIDGDMLEMKYELPELLYIMSNEGFQITDEQWMEQLEEWIDELKIDLVILDPLMMLAEGVDEFKAFDLMTKALKPLKRLRSRTKAAICVVHHHTKTVDKTGAAAMYGSVALWAWEESAMHLQMLGPSKILAERFSKHSRLTPVTVEIPNIDAGWAPHVYAGGSQGKSDLLDLISASPTGLTLPELQETTGLSRDVLQRQLKNLKGQKKIEEGTERVGGGQRGRRKKLWKAVQDKGVE